MLEQLIPAIASQGVLGVFVVVSSVVIYRLYGQVQAAQQQAARDVSAAQLARIEDARTHQAQLLRITEASIAAITQSTAATGACREALCELRDALSALSDETRRSAARVARQQTHRGGHHDAPPKEPTPR